MVKKQDVPYTKVGPLPERFKQSATEHGYNTFWGRIIYALRFLCSFYLNLLAMLMPYSGPRVFLHKLRGVKVGKNVLIGFNVTIDNTYPNLVTIEDGVSLAGNNLILAHSKPLEYHKDIFKSYVAPVVIKKNAWVTVGVIVLAGVTVGEGSIITANSVVTKNIPPNCLAAGNPAKVIKKLDAGDEREVGITE